MARVSVIGAGYVGLVTAACFGEKGHQVTCVDIVAERVEALRRGQVPIQEPGLAELWNKHLESGALEVTDSHSLGMRDCDFIFICVGSPSLPDGSTDLAQVVSAARSVADHVSGNPILVVKSTIPLGTANRLAKIVNADRSSPSLIHVVSNPEFLREGEAVVDFMNPDRVILGAADRSSAEAVASLYTPLTCPVLFCDNATAEMVKYASNAFLATKISFINEIASLCEPFNVEVNDVARGMGMDHRIGADFLKAGLGWGGSCLPKDISALAAMARESRLPSPLLDSVFEVNSKIPSAVAMKLDRLLGGLQRRTVGVWGLTFKPDTDDLRESPAVMLANLLVNTGCTVKAYDPAVNRCGSEPARTVTYCANPYEAARDSDAVVLATAWQEFLSLDMARVREEMRGNLFFDARNAFDPRRLSDLGFTYLAIGRDGVVGESTVQVNGYSHDKESELISSASKAAIS